LFALSIPYATISNRGRGGSVPEWLMGADCKSAGYAYAGSNPARPIHEMVSGSQFVVHAGCFNFLRVSYKL
jgi:hypothetical protein